MWDKDPYTFAPSGGESGLAVTARALPALLEIVAAHPGGTILVVSHKGDDSIAAQLAARVRPRAASATTLTRAPAR